LDVSQKLTALCVVDETGRRLWRGQCATDPGQIERTVRGHAGEGAKIGVETGPMTPWLVHELRGRELEPRLRTFQGNEASISQRRTGPRSQVNVRFRDAGVELRTSLMRREAAVSSLIAMAFIIPTKT